MIAKRYHVVADEHGDVLVKGLTPQQPAEVIVLQGGEVPEPSNKGKVMDLVGSWNGLFKSADEVDAYINEMRDEWER